MTYEYISNIFSHFLLLLKTDGKYLVLPSGELHIREVGPEDGYKSYQCRTKHRLTGETRLSATKGRLVITGKSFWDILFITNLELIIYIIIIENLIRFHINNY